MSIVKVEGSVTIGPDSSGSGAFPTSSDSATLQTTPDPKGSQCASGTMRRTVFTAAPTWGVLSGVGPSDTVTKADFLYLRTNAPVKLRLTMDDKDNSGGPQVVSVVQVYGTLMMEFPTPGCLTLLEIQGSAQIEYAVSGQT